MRNAYAVSDRAPTVGRERWGPITVLLFGLLVLAWAGNYLFVRVGEQEVAPLWLAALRAAVGAAGVGVYLMVRPRASLTGADRRDALLLGIPNTAVFLGLWFVAARSVPPGEAAVIVYTFPLWVAVFSPGLLGARIDARHWGAILVGFLGVALVSQPWTGGVSRAVAIPLAELLGAAVSWAVATVLFQRRFSPEQLASVNGLQLVSGAAALLVGAAVLGQYSTPVLSLDLWISVLWLGLFGTAFAYVVWFHLLRSVHASTLSAYSFLVPLTALALSAVFDGERVDLVQWAGVLCVLLGIYLVGSRPLPAPALARGAAAESRGSPPDEPGRRD